MTTETLHDLSAWRAALARHPLVMLFKHSPVCPISAAALREWRAFTAAHPEVPTLFVDVIGDRPVSRGLAEECGVQHQSPQAILFRDGRPAWHASHGGITADSLARAAGV
jgi:bacillithiol system protein YtxJ